MKCTRPSIIFFLMLLVLPNIVLAAGYYQYCVDSDNGLTYSAPGKVYVSFNKNPTEGEKQGLPDICQQGGAVVSSCTGENCYLGEYGCTKSSQGYLDVQYELKKCANLGYTSCAEGACYGKLPTEIAVNTPQSEGTITVRTNKVRDTQAIAVPVVENEEMPIVTQAEQPAQGEIVVIKDKQKKQTRLPQPKHKSVSGKASNILRNAVDERNSKERTSLAGCEDSCGFTYEIREAIMQRIIDLENAIHQLLDVEIKKIAQEQIKEQVKGFLASCETAWDGDTRTIQRYGTCTRYCAEAEHKTCLSSIGYNSMEISTEESDYEGPRYPIFRPVACSEPYNTNKYISISCMCCSFPS